MPELPEVETVKVGLARLLPDKVVKSVEHDNAKSFPNAAADIDMFLLGAKVITVRRRAKVLLIELSSKYSLVTHLKMTGQLVFIGTAQTSRHPKLDLGSSKKVMAEGHVNSDWIPDRVGNDRGGASDVRFGAGHPSKSLIGELPDRSTRVALTFTDGSKLFFNDQRKFGWMRLMPTAEVVNLDFFKKVGPEPLSQEFTWQMMRNRLLRRKNSNIKAALLDQTVIAGVGNIYADESLWGAKIHPATRARDLTDTKFKALHKALVDVLNLSISLGGSTDQHYVDAEGKPGKYLTFANVFRREGLPCPRCGTIIEKTRVAGRGTHFCPHCQNI